MKLLKCDLKQDFVSGCFIVMFTLVKHVHSLHHPRLLSSSTQTAIKNRGRMRGSKQHKCPTNYLKDDQENISSSSVETEDDNSDTLKGPQPANVNSKQHRTVQPERFCRTTNKKTECFLMLNVPFHSCANTYALVNLRHKGQKS